MRILIQSSIIRYLIGIVICFQGIASAQDFLPDCWTIVSDDFETGIDPGWRRVPSDDPSAQPWHAPGQGFQGSGGMAVTVTQDESYLYRSRIADAKEAYISFLFHPSSANIPDEGTSWIPGKSIRIADIKGGDEWHLLAGLRIRRVTGSGYTGYVEWYGPDGSEYDYETGEFPIADTWQLITLGFRTDTFIEVWINGVSVRRIAPVDHEQETGSIFEFGKCSANSSMTPSGTIFYDSVTVQIPRIYDLYVEPETGNDDHSGTTAADPLRTVQRAAELAGPGTRVHLLPGIYRETVRPVMSGTAAEPMRFFAENGRGTARIRGSIASDMLIWTQLQSDPIGLPPGVAASSLYWTELTGITASPRWIAQLDPGGELAARLPVAREPDWNVATVWKRHEFWWCADGGSAPAECDPSTDPDCDMPWRSLNQLTDVTSDTEPAGVEPGNLGTLGDLTGGTLVSIDTKQGHYVYRRTIVDHDAGAGRITVDPICEHDGGSGDPGLGMYSKYYVENRPCLLDTPGEWWFDPATARLYLWPPGPGNPAQQSIEISVLDDGFNLRDVSYVHLQDLVIEYFNESCIEHENWSETKSYGNRILNCELRYANYGFYIVQSIEASQSPDYQTRDLLIQGNVVHHIDTHAIRHVDWWENSAAADSWVRPGIIGTVIRNNDFHELGFNCDGDNAVGLSFGWSDHLTFEGNHVHEVAHNGVQFSRSVIQSDKEYGFTPDEIKTGDILVMDNIFENACQLTCDNGGIKFWGKPPDGHVFRNVLVTGNISRNNFGWTYCSEKRGRWTAGQARGTGGFGFYVDMAAGVTFFRNIAYNNGYTGWLFSGVWRDGDVTVVNNVSANNIYGYIFGGSSFDTHGCINTTVYNNFAINNEGYGMLISDGDDVYDNMTYDHNLYYANGWNDDIYRGGSMTIYVGSGNHYYQSVEDIRTGRGWETHGMEADPWLEDYDPLDHDRHDGSWADFHVIRDMSPAVDAGTSAVYPPVGQLMAQFGLDPQREGPAFDIGRFETYPYSGLPDGVILWMPGQMFEPGDPCACLAGVVNNGRRILKGYPLFVILDVYGQLYFAPGFAPAFDCYLDELPEIPHGLTIVQVLPLFAWPPGAGTANGIRWYGAVTDPAVTGIIGDIGIWTFGWR